MQARKAMWIFIFLALFATINDRLLFIIFPTYLIEKNFSATEIGIIFSVAALAIVVLRTFIGKLSDRYGRKGILSIGLLVNSISVSFYPVISKLQEFAVVKSIQEASFSLKEGVEDSIQADAFPKKERPRYLIKLGKALPLSRAVAAVIGFFITAYLSVVSVFYAAAFSAFVALLIFAIFYKEKKTKRSANNKSFFNPVKYPRKFNALVITIFLQTLAFGVVYSPAFFILAERVLKIRIDALFLLFLLAYIVSAVIVHFLESRVKNFGTKFILFLTTILFAILSLMYAFTNVILFSLAMIGIAATYYIWRISSRTVAMDSAESVSRGEQLGFMRTMDGVGAVLGPLIGGFLIDFYSLQIAFILGSLVYLATALLILKAL